MRHKRIVPLLLVVLTAPLAAYVGPGAGFAFAGSFFFIFAAFFLAIFNFLTFPLRAFFHWLKRRKTTRHARNKRVIVVGFDGMDYALFRRFQQQGHSFPNFEALEKEGTFAPLLSTEPPISPVAWSTFSTGVNPGKHNIFDFLTTDRATYMPKLACSDILPAQRVFRLGPWEFPLKAARIELLRKSQSFWKVVSDRGIPASVLRVPFTFPPEKFYGVMLSGLGTPDLRGTQGSFTFFSDSDAAGSEVADVVFARLEKLGENDYRGEIPGPPHPFRQDHRPMPLALSVTVDPAAKRARVKVGKETMELAEGQLSPWMPMKFRAGLATIRGIAQWSLQSASPLRLYLSPLNLDPESPAMPVSHPRIFSVYLAKLLGPFATLGMAEDTWAVNEGILSERTFLDQVNVTQAERERVFFDQLKKTRSGLLVQVFEATDRVQHMFWKYLPGAQSPSPQPAKDDPAVREAILRCYQQMDGLLGRLRPRMKRGDLLLIVSDHGFGPFDHCFHLNTWLKQEGYLVLAEGKTLSGKWYEGIDWSKSRAYGQGLNGIFLNVKGRERQGIVDPGAEAELLKKEIAEKLLKVVDPQSGGHPVKAAFPREMAYRGPYVPNAPDVVVGYTVGYRVSWESAVNEVGDRLFSDNVRMWSGDHAFTRAQVPGIFFANQRIQVKDPALLDIAPTVYGALGVPRPSFVEGRDLMAEGKTVSPR
ncbi:MAG TPA: alkaline phosphatase family protein [Candidatus Aminicenantes bacterium]|nr:alkaline phosphatase family protein [Candidatus Aminicenantes bacterium]